MSLSCPKRLKVVDDLDLGVLTDGYEELVGRTVSGSGRERQRSANCRESQVGMERASVQLSDDSLDDVGSSEQRGSAVDCPQSVEKDVDAVNLLCLGKGTVHAD